MHVSQKSLLRIAAFLVDELILALVLIVPASAISYSLLWITSASRAVNLTWYAAALALLAGTLLRDGYRGRSPGKRLLGLHLKTGDQEACSVRRSILRNLTLLVPVLNLVDFYLVLSGKDRTGDRLAGTTVIEE